MQVEINKVMAHYNYELFKASRDLCNNDVHKSMNYIN